MEDIADVGYDMEHTNHSNCSDLTFSQLKTLAIVKGALSIFSIFPCLIVVFLIVYFKSYRSFVHRLALYLTVSAIFYSVTTALQMVPGDLFSIHNQPLCKAVGFLVEYGSWILLLYIYWVLVHLFLLSVFHLTTKRAEAILVLLPYLLPFIFIWIPFVTNLYGQAGGWCWIVTATEECEKIMAGQIEQFILWYCPMFVASVGSIVVTMTTVIVLCKGACQTSHSSDSSRDDGSAPYLLQEQHKRALKEALPLLAYSILFSLFDWVAIASRVYYAITDGSNYPLWLVHTIGDACRGLFIPLAFLLHPSVCKKINSHNLKMALQKWRWRSSYTTTFFVVSKEHSDISEQLIVTGRRGEGLNRDTTVRDTGYQSIFDPLEN